MGLAPFRCGVALSVHVCFIHLNFCLKLTLKCSEACVVFKAGKNRDGYFLMRRLAKTSEHSMTCFESKTSGFATGLFIFDTLQVIKSGAPELCLLARCPKIQQDWSHKKDGPRMRNGKFCPSSTSQDFYFPEDLHYARLV